MTDANYTYAYPRPILAADSVILGVTQGALQVLLIRRGHAPFEGHWALPGGFVNENEPLDLAAARELSEETGLERIQLKQIGAFGDPGRDPRGWAVSIVYMALINPLAHALRAGDDASDARWFPLDALPPVAFDHLQILEYAVSTARTWGKRDGLGAQFLPEEFTHEAFAGLYYTLVGEAPADDLLLNVLDPAGATGAYRFRNPAHVPL